MIISVSGIDGAGKTLLVKLLAQKLNFFIPEHVSYYEKFPEDIVKWYTKENIDNVVRLDLKAFTKRNQVALSKRDAILDRGYQNIIDSACARYQQRLKISYLEALEMVEKVNKIIGFSKIEEKAVLLDFPFNDWQKIHSILIKRVGSFSREYNEYLQILNHNIKTSRHSYDLIINATEKPEENLKKILI